MDHTKSFKHSTKRHYDCSWENLEGESRGPPPTLSMQFLYILKLKFLVTGTLIIQYLQC